MNTRKVPELTERQKALFTEEGAPRILRHYMRLPVVLKILGTQELRLDDIENFTGPKDKQNYNA
jgi:hypothetical protein